MLLLKVILCCWRRMLNSPAIANELPTLELSGLGHSRTVRELRQLVKETKLDLVFLMETKMRNPRLQRVRCSLGFT